MTDLAKEQQNESIKKLMKELKQQKNTIGKLERKINTLLDKNKLKTLFSQAFTQDFQVCIHAIGDKANREIIYALREVFENSDYDQFDHRTRIEHAQIIKARDIKEISDLNIITSVQPMHCISDMHMAEERLGERILFRWS